MVCLDFISPPPCSYMSLSLATAKNSNGFVSGQGLCNGLQGGPQAPCVIQAQSPCYLTTSKPPSRAGLWISYLSVKLTNYSPVTDDNKPVQQVHCSLENVSGLKCRRTIFICHIFIVCSKLGVSSQKDNSITNTEKTAWIINSTTSIQRKLLVKKEVKIVL